MKPPQGRFAVSRRLAGRRTRQHDLALACIAGQCCGKFECRPRLVVADALRDAGCLLGSQQLESHQTARTLRIRDGVARITDGPFAETREILAGFNLIEAANIDEAMRIAHAFPWARFGSIEVRPVRDMAAVRRRVGIA